VREPGRLHPPVDGVNGHYPELVPSTRDRLIDAAAMLLDEGGPAAVTLREVGRLAGVSHNAPYKHFADKEDLLAAVAARELARAPRAGSGASGSPADALGQMMHGYVDWALRHPARFKLTFGSWSVDSAELGTAAAAARSTLVTAVAAAQASKDLPGGDPERLAALIQATTHGAVDLALSGHLAKNGKGHADPKDLVDDLLACLSHGPHRG
jgi:AcrR family transcriptional regulator